METIQQTAKLYRNHLKGGYSVENGKRSFVITRTSCFYLGKETLWLVKNLPANGRRETFVETLANLGLGEPEKIYDKLISLGILQEFHPRHAVKAVFSWLIRPDIRLISSELQERFIAFVGLRRFHGVLNKIFYPLAAIALLGLASAILLSHLSPQTGASGGWQIFLLIAFGSLAHELGHSLAASAAGIGLRPVGFSVYLFYPVFYTNVSGMEKLNLLQKLAIDCGGLVAQSIYLLALCLVVLTTGNHICFEAVKWILLIMAFNVNPLLKTDGYWVYNDIREYFSGQKWVENIHRAYLAAFIVFSVYLLFRVSISMGAIIHAITAIAQQPARILSDGYKIIIGVYFLVMAVSGGLRRIQESRHELSGSKSAEAVPSKPILNLT